MTVRTRYEHVVLGADSVPFIAGTTMKVAELVLAHLAYGWSPEELHFQFPHLTLGTIHSALAYYWDHQADMDADIERRLAAINAQRRATGQTALVARLKAEGLI